MWGVANLLSIWGAVNLPYRVLSICPAAKNFAKHIESALQGEVNLPCSEKSSLNILRCAVVNPLGDHHKEERCWLSR